MIPNTSPWIQQLKANREIVPLKQNISTDVVVVGGGIAGITTCYFILKHTDKRVVLLESDRIAHGATGHNAGQIASYFERELSELVNEFGLEMAIEGQKSVESAWDLIDEIMDEAKLQVSMYTFDGHAGICDFDKVIVHLQNNLYRHKGNLKTETILIAEEWEQSKDIPSDYCHLYKLVPQKDLLDLLETNNTDYIACLSYKKGCMNSALFTEELLGFLITRYNDRLSFYESSPVKLVKLNEGHAILSVLEHNVDASKVVLCTNGFENFTIQNEVGVDIDTTFHHMINGRIGYMSGYIEAGSSSPIAISYFPKDGRRNEDPTGENYFYLTRRPHEHKDKDFYSLVCTGGPERVLPNGALYSRKDTHSEETQYAINNFLESNYSKYNEKEKNHLFSWHGLMGYTPNGVRRIGPEPCNEVLLYNIGCNGVGILPSIFGGKRISSFINNEKLEKSIFDPKDQRVL